MRPTAVFVTLLFLSGCLTGVPSGGEPETGEASVAHAVESPTTSAGGADDVRLLSRSDVQNRLAERGEDPETYEFGLFYVDADGTWYRADPNGTVSAVAPDGDVVPGIVVDDPSRTPANERIDVAAADRPAYVWKVTKRADPPTTVVVDADSGETLGVWTVPGGGRAPPSTATAMATTERR
ncbi:hypothetical protein SAMN04487948_105341 [Halogranum amylolyticum]|uniref:Peptidase propeptide and YPEB domain-containing protein n=1 Tax=Halogranum amylolyticum TaxID=660520 RepID=A0A1H8SUL0_9EURY|nr:hypothetical protein [Halogranum amylolyticum]SEO82440.1 hypothetical protein SAMN04487948_105341 [Halogranum amylolyticum]